MHANTLYNTAAATAAAGMCVGVWVSMNVQVSSLGATHRHMERHNFNGMRDMKMDKVVRFHFKIQIIIVRRETIEQYERIFGTGFFMVA